MSVGVGSWIGLEANYRTREAANKWFIYSFHKVLEMMVIEISDKGIALNK